MRLAHRDGHDAARGAGRGEGARLRRLDADHADRRVGGLGKARDAADEAAAADGDDDRVHVRPGVSNLQGDGAAAGNDVLLAVRRDEDRAGGPGKLHRHPLGVFVVGGDRTQFGAVAANGSELGLRRRRRREHDRAQAEPLGGPGDRTPMIAGRGRHHHRRRVQGRQPGQRIQGAAHLERSRHLQRLELQPYVGRGERRQPRRVDQRRRGQMRCQAATGRNDVVDWNHQGSMISSNCCASSLPLCRRS